MSNNLVSITRETHRRHEFKVTLMDLDASLSIYSNKYIPGDHEVTVRIDFQYGNYDEPVRVYAIPSRYCFGYRGSFCKTRFGIDVYLDSNYAAMISGVEPSIFIHESYVQPVGNFLFKVHENSLVKIEITVRTLLRLYFVESKYGIVTAIIEKLKRKSREALDISEKKNYDALIGFLGWLRDSLFPLLDHAMDISEIRTLSHLYHLRGGDCYRILSLIEFVFNQNW